MTSRRSGATQTPYHVLSTVPRYDSGGEQPPPSFFVRLPAKLRDWGNDFFGDCGPAEEAFAKAAAPPYVDLRDEEVITWALQHGMLVGSPFDPTDMFRTNRAEGERSAHSYFELLKFDGFIQDGKQYLNGSDYFVIDIHGDRFCEDLQHAIYQHGPVKLLVNPTGLQTNHETGWVWLKDPKQISQGGPYYSRGYPDHYFSACGYGTYAACRQTLMDAYPDLKKPVPHDPPAEGVAPYFLVFTWGTIGIVDWATLESIVFEAWVRSPVTQEPPIDVSGSEGKSLVIEAAGQWRSAEQEGNDHRLRTRADLVGESSSGDRFLWTVSSVRDSTLRLQWIQKLQMSDDGSSSLECWEDGSLAWRLKRGDSSCRHLLCDAWQTAENNVAGLVGVTLQSTGDALLDFSNQLIDSHQYSTSDLFRAFGTWQLDASNNRVTVTVNDPPGWLKQLENNPITVASSFVFVYEPGQHQLALEGSDTEDFQFIRRWAPKINHDLVGAWGDSDRGVELEINADSTVIYTPSSSDPQVRFVGIAVNDPSSTVQVLLRWYENYHVDRSVARPFTAQEARFEAASGEGEDTLTIGERRYTRETPQELDPRLYGLWLVNPLHTMKLDPSGWGQISCSESSDDDDDDNVRNLKWSRGQGGEITVTFEFHLNFGSSDSYRLFWATGQDSTTSVFASRKETYDYSGDNPPAYHTLENEPHPSSDPNGVWSVSPWLLGVLRVHRFVGSANDVVAISPTGSPRSYEATLQEVTIPIPGFTVAMSPMLTYYKLNFSTTLKLETDHDGKIEYLVDKKKKWVFARRDPS